MGAPNRPAVAGINFLETLSFFTSFLFFFSALFCQASSQKSGKHQEVTVKITDKESLWTGRFSDCDFGYYVLLDGVVAHGNHPPTPIHGFLIGLPDRFTTDPVTIGDERFIAVSAVDNSSEFASLDDAANWIVGLSREKPGFKLLAEGAVRFNDRDAKRVKFEYNRPKGKFVEERVMALREGILYQICLRTTQIDYDADAPTFATIVNNFKWYKIQSCP
jgi:hypothetical protein